MLLLLTAVLCISIALGHVGNKVCLEATKRNKLYAWNSTIGPNDGISSIFLGSVDPPDSFTHPVVVGKRINFVIYRNTSTLTEHKDLCSESELSLSDRYLSFVKHNSNYPTVSNHQTSLFARVAIEGIASNNNYYRKIRHKTEVVEELENYKSDESSDFHACWCQWTPSTPGVFELTVRVDFVDCHAPLLSVSSIHDRHLDPLHALSTIIYKPVMKLSITVVASNTRRKQITQFCDLSDMRQGFWMSGAAVINTTNALPSLPHTMQIEAGYKNASSGSGFDALDQAMMTASLQQQQQQVAWLWMTPNCDTFHLRASMFRDVHEIVMMGDSNSHRICAGMHRKCTVLGDGVGSLDRASFLNDKMTGYNLKSFNAFLKQCIAVSGSSYCMVNIGHHIVGINATQLQSMITPTLQWLKRDLSQSSHPTRLAFWSTIASASEKLSIYKHNKTFHFLSNFYREFKQHELLFESIHGMLLPTSDPHNHHQKECNYQYIDMFSSSSALMDICHTDNDPVHFSRNCQSMFTRLLEQVVVVMAHCGHTRDCVDRVPLKSTEIMRYYKGMDPSIGNLPYPVCVYNQAGVCIRYNIPR